jgi:hypothetical protein
LNGKVLEFGASLQLLSQPDGLRSSACPGVSLFVAMFGGHLPALHRASPSTAYLAANFESWLCNWTALWFRTFPISSRSFMSDSTDIEPRFALAIFIC